MVARVVDARLAEERRSVADCEAVAVGAVTRGIETGSLGGRLQNPFLVYELFTPAETIRPIV